MCKLHSPLHGSYLNLLPYMFCRRQHKLHRLYYYRNKCLCGRCKMSLGVVNGVASFITIDTIDKHLQRNPGCFFHSDCTS